MAVRTVKVIMNGVTGRMGYRQHLVRSILAIRDEGGVVVGDDRIQVVPVLVGRSEAKLAKLAELHGVSDWTTDLDAALADPEARSTSTPRSPPSAPAPSWPPSTPASTSTPRSPSPSPCWTGRSWDRRPAAGIITGVVHDKLYLPGLLKLKRLIDLGFFGRILSVRGEFGYWVFEGDGSPRSGPAGTTAPRTAAASSWTCSRTGTTCWRTCSARSRP